MTSPDSFFFRWTPRLRSVLRGVVNLTPRDTPRVYALLWRTVPIVLVFVLVAAGCSHKPDGDVEIQIPEDGVRSLEWVRLRGGGSKPTVWTHSNLTSRVTGRLPAGEYQVILGFANSNYKPPTEVDVGRLVIQPGTPRVFSCGLLSFDVRSGLPDLNLSAVVVRGQGASPTVELQNTGNTYYFFLPKPLPPGAYDVALLYHRSPAPSVMATGVVIQAGAAITVKMDSGLVLRPPADGKVTGWSLFRDGTDQPWLMVRRGSDNDEPLWRRFMVPPGTYQLSVERDPPPANPARETLTIEAGQTLVHTLQNATTGAPGSTGDR